MFVLKKEKLIIWERGLKLTKMVPLSREMDEIYLKV